MPASQSVHDSLASVSFAQLLLMLAVLFAYSLALGSAFGARVRAGAALAAVLAAAGFCVATPAWADGIVLVALAVVGVAVFAALAWLLAAMLQVGPAAGAAIVDGAPTREAPLARTPELSPLAGAAALPTSW
jgi:hypothetical protein